MKCCDQCGRTNKDTDTVCVGCGAPLPDEPNVVFNKSEDNSSSEPVTVEYSTPVSEQAPDIPAVNSQIPEQAPAPEIVAGNKAEFLVLESNKDITGLITASGIICYVAAAITLIFSVIIGGNPLSWIDVGILVICGIGVHALQSRVFATLLTVYAAANIIISLIMGVFGGIPILLAGIFALVATTRFHSRWAQYKQEHNIPDKNPSDDN